MTRNNQCLTSESISCLALLTMNLDLQSFYWPCLVNREAVKMNGILQIDKMLLLTLQSYGREISSDNLKMLHLKSRHTGWSRKSWEEQVLGFTQQKKATEEWRGADKLTSWSEISDPVHKLDSLCCGFLSFFSLTAGIGLCNTVYMTLSPIPISQEDSFPLQLLHMGALYYEVTKTLQTVCPINFNFYPYL